MFKENVNIIYYSHFILKVVIVFDTSRYTCGIINLKLDLTKTL